MPQNLVFDHSSPLTVADMLCANLSRRPVWLGQRKAARAHAEEMLRRAGAAHSLLDKRLGTLSGGELQRVLLAFALDPIPDLLLLDEPVSAVDRRGIEVFYELVSTLRERYHMPVILVSHDLSHVRQYATTAALLDRTIPHQRPGGRRDGFPRSARNVWPACKGGGVRMEQIYGVMDVLFRLSGRSFPS